MTTSALPRSAAHTLTVRKQLQTPATDPRRLLRSMRHAVVRRGFALGAVLLPLCLLHIWVHHRVDDVGKQLWEAHKLVQRLEQERSELTLERETIKDHARLAEFAREKLGLVPPRKGQIVEVR